MKLGKKLLVILTALIMVLLCFASCGGNPDDEKTAQLTNEQLIENRINEFLTAYNNGDMDGWYISDMTDKSSSGNGGSDTQNPNGSNSSTTLYYVTTYSNTSEYGTAGTYTEYNKTNFAVGSKVLLEATVNDG